MKRWSGLLVVFALMVSALLSAAPLSAHAAPLQAPRVAAISFRTTTSMSFRFFRSPDAGGMCRPDIGYEVLGGVFTDWHDAGGFPNAPCDDPDPGYRFFGLLPNTTYTLSIRAYRVVDGVKVDHSAVSSITGTTLADATPTPTPTPTATATPTPTPTPTATVPAIAAPRAAAISFRTTTSLSVRFFRSPDSGGTCRPDIGYEVTGGAFGDWQDVGGFANVCSDADPAYRFNGLLPGTGYTLSLRAYRLVDGVKVSYSAVSSITGTTLAEPAPTVTAGASATPSPTPSQTGSSQRQVVESDAPTAEHSSDPADASASPEPSEVSAARPIGGETP